jgi:hypothetical protein
MTAQPAARHTAVLVALIANDAEVDIQFNKAWMAAGGEVVCSHGDAVHAPPKLCVTHASLHDVARPPVYSITKYPSKTNRGGGGGVV